MTQYKTIADLPPASAVNPQDLFELSQFGTSRAVALATVLAAAPPAGVPEAPIDGRQYARQSAAWAAVAPAGGTVTAVSVVSANGLAGTVATPSTTPALTLSCGVTGLLKGNGTAISAAVAGTDYVVPSALSAYAPLASPSFTGDPQAPTPASTDNDTSIATTAFVKAQGYAVAANYLPLAGGTLTGTLGWNKGAPLTVSTPAFAVQQTWNNGATNFNAVLLDITNTASAYPSYPFQIKINGSTWYWIDQFGGCFANGGLFTTGNVALQSTAPTAGGVQDTGVSMSSTSHLGLYYGLGAASTVQARGSIYLDNASPGVPWFNTDGSTGWSRLAPITAVGTAPPATPVDGQLWFCSDASTGGGTLYIRYNDGNTTQWVAATPPTSGPPVSLLEARVAELEARLLALESP